MSESVLTVTQIVDLHNRGVFKLNSIQCARAIEAAVLSALAEKDADAVQELTKVRPFGTIMRDVLDARRYRWLRAVDNNVHIVLPEPPDDACIPHTDKLDAYIDAALQSAGDGEKTT